MSAAIFAGAAIAILQQRTRNIAGRQQVGAPPRSHIVSGSGMWRFTSFNRARQRSMQRLWTWSVHRTGEK